MIDHLSYSSVYTYLTCPRAWYYKYCTDLVTPTSEAQFFGKVFHAAIGAYIQSDKQKAPAEFWPTAWTTQLDEDDRIAWNGKTPDEVYNEGIRLLSDDDITETLKEVTPFRPEMTELPIRFQIPGVSIPIIGFVDAIIGDGMPCEFKTTKHSWPQGRAQTEIQPALYLAALKQMGVLEPAPSYFTHFVFVRTKKPKVDIFVTSWGKADLIWATGMVRDAYAGIRVGYFPPNPFTWKCSATNCEFWSECRG